MSSSASTDHQGTRPHSLHSVGFEFGLQIEKLEFDVALVLEFGWFLLQAVILKGLELSLNAVEVVGQISAVQLLSLVLGPIDEGLSLRLVFLLLTIKILDLLHDVGYTTAQNAW